MPGELLRQDVALSERLTAYMTSDRLDENAYRYPEMTWRLSSSERLGIKAVESVLLQLDLSHTTGAPYEDFYNGILPNSQLPEVVRDKGHTVPFDRSLGLDHYVFMHHGVFDDNGHYGANQVVIDAKLLLDGRTIVTPSDVCVSADASHDFNNSDPWIRNGVETAYFDQMVRGRDWVAIIARRVFAHLVDNDFSEYGLSHEEMFGEVKYHGVVAPRYIKGYVTPEDRPKKWREMMELGFVPQPVYRAKGRRLSHTVLLQHIGADHGTTRRAWKSLITHSMRE